MEKSPWTPRCFSEKQKYPGPFVNYGRCMPARLLPLWKLIRVKLTWTLGETITPSATTPWIIVSSSRRPQCLPGMMTLLCHRICERESITVPPSLPTWEDRFTCSIPSFFLDQSELPPVPLLCFRHPPNVSSRLFGSIVSRASAFRRLIDIKLHNYLCLLRISYSSYLLT